MPPKTSGGLVPVIVYLPPEEHVKLKQLAEADGRTMSALIRYILAHRNDDAPPE